MSWLLLTVKLNSIAATEIEAAPVRRSALPDVSG
jgi:hypothetical protein